MDKWKFKPQERKTVQSTLRKRKEGQGWGVATSKSSQGKG
jgi:hypothetical protein